MGEVLDQMENMEERERMKILFILILKRRKGFLIKA